MVLIQHLFGIPSLRQTYRETQLNVAYRWFLGYSLPDRIPHFDIVSYALYESQRLGSGNKLGRAEICMHESEKAGSMELEKLRFRWFIARFFNICTKPCSGVIRLCVL